MPLFCSFEGPKFWSKEKSDCSGDVQLQSPIDIPKVSTEKRKYDSSMKKMLFINYDKEIKGEVKNNGNNGMSTNTFVRSCNVTSRENLSSGFGPGKTQTGLLCF